MKAESQVQSIADFINSHGAAKRTLRGSAIGKISELIDLLSLVVEAIEMAEIAEIPSVVTSVDFYSEVSRFEAALIKQALKRAGGSQVKAAKLLNLGPTTLNTKIKMLDIDWRAERVSYPGAN